MLSMVFQALLEKNTISIASCMRALVIQSDVDGEPLAFDFAKNFGNVPSFAHANGISAVMIVHASQLAKTDMSRPIFISHAPHGPTTFSSTPAVDGFATDAISCWLITPNGRTESIMKTISPPRNPMMVALPTSPCDFARPERTTAPSMPINAQSVTSIVLFICAPSPPSVCPSIAILPQKSNVNLSQWKANMRIIENSKSGTSLPTVPIIFIMEACFTPASTTKLNVQISTDPPSIDQTLFPPVNTPGKK